MSMSYMFQEKTNFFVTVLVNFFLDAIWHGIGWGMDTSESGINPKMRMNQDKI